MFITPYPRFQFIAGLSTLRQEWQDSAEGESLLDIEGNVGLLLADLVNVIGLSTHEQSLVLGPELFDELRDMLVLPPQN